MLEAHGEVDDDRLPLHDVARRLAEVVDMAEVLRTLCDIASRQCHATGAAVLRMTGKMGEVVAAVGNVVPARGRCFELEGLADRGGARSAASVVHEENFSDSGRPLMRVVPELTLGPMLVAPLRAHGETLGVLAVTRGAAGPPSPRASATRLRVLADHAALAVHKSLLLQQAQSADRAKGRFLATMSHELRTPLTALAGYGELLADQVIGPMSEPQLDILERMRSVTTHLSAMIEEILAFTSLEEGREAGAPERVPRRRPRALRARRWSSRWPSRSGIALELKLPVDGGADDERHRQGAPDPREPARQRGEVHRSGHA